MLLSGLTLLASALPGSAQSSDPLPSASEQTVAAPVLRGPKAAPIKQEAVRTAAPVARPKVNEVAQSGQSRRSSFRRGILKTLNFVGFPIGDENLTLAKQSEQVVPQEVQEALGSRNAELPETSAAPLQEAKP